MVKHLSRTIAVLVGIAMLVTLLPVSVYSSNIPANGASNQTKVFFDDFNYVDSQDSALVKMGWIAKDGAGGPGVSGCSWSKGNITFVSDPQKAGNKIARLTSSTDGTGAGTSQSELYQQGKFYEGTYATRVRFNDKPVEGPDGDNIVETFFTITLGKEGNPDYGENDFEYLPNGGWGEAGPVFYSTTWENVIPEPWTADRDFSNRYESYDGWHDLVLTVMDGHVEYYIDGSLVADHSGRVYPEIPMSINYNLWYIDGGLLKSGETRVYTQDIDWVYYAEDTLLTPEQALQAVGEFRERNNPIERKDTVKTKNGNIPAAGTLTIDSEINTGDYTVSIPVPSNSKATSLKLYENGSPVLVKALTSPEKGKTYTYPVNGKAPGEYIYRVDMSNPDGTRVGQDHTVRVVSALFDDFNYSDPGDEELADMGWTVKESTTEGPGPIGCSWSKNNITFVNDPVSDGNKLARLTSTTDGTNEGTSQAEIFQQRKFYEGTYAARVKFNDSPDIGIDGDSIVETFFTITPLDHDMDPDYCECDFEYMPNGGWGDPTGFMYETTWETYQADPWVAINKPTFQYSSFEGWHTLVATVKDGAVKYYIDGILMAEHGDKYYPEHPMSVNFNLWYVNGGLLDSGETRQYTQDIDWMYFAEDVALTPEQVGTVVDGYRASGATRLDTVKEKDGAGIPAEAARLSVDSAVNSGIYNVQVAVPASSTATSVRLYENGKLVMVRSLSPDSSQVRTFLYSAEDMPVSTYEYTVELSNLNGTLSGEALTVEVKPGAFAVNVALNRAATGGNGLYNNPTALNDGDKISEEGHYTGVGGEGLQWAQIDFGRSYDVNKVNVWHYYADGRIIHDLVIQLSNDPDFKSGVTTVFNNDRNNSAGLGAGADSEYAETADGKTINFNTVSARYIRHYQNGSLTPNGDNPYNQIVELEVWSAGGDEGAAKLTVDNIYNTGDYAITAVVPANCGAESLYLYENDEQAGSFEVTPASETEQAFRWEAAGKDPGVYRYKAVMDSGNGEKISAMLEVTVTEADPAPRTAALSVDDNQNEGSYTVTITIPSECRAAALDLFEGNDIVQSYETVPDSGSEGTFEYEVSGKPTGRYEYTAVLTNENGSSASEKLVVWVVAPVEPGVPANAAMCKPVTGGPDSVTAADAGKITDADKGADSYVGAGENLQWIQVDLGQNYDIDKVKIWHYFADGRTYKDIIVQVSDTADFAAFITVFNNDADNSAGFGAGTDTEYAESADGKEITFDALSARYVRFYSNGSNGGYPPANHYVEVEVWTA